MANTKKKTKSQTTRKRKQPGVVARCMGCGTKRVIYAGEVAPGDHPLCEKCFLPMIAKSAYA